MTSLASVSTPQHLWGVTLWKTWWLKASPFLLVFFMKPLGLVRAAVPGSDSFTVRQQRGKRRFTFAPSCLWGFLLWVAPLTQMNTWPNRLFVVSANRCRRFLRRFLRRSRFRLPSLIVSVDKPIQNPSLSLSGCLYGGVTTYMWRPPLHENCFPLRLSQIEYKEIPDWVRQSLKLKRQTVKVEKACFRRWRMSVGFDRWTVQSLKTTPKL